MKFRDLEKGMLGGRLEDFELPGGAVVKVRVVPLLAGRDREIESGAAEYARAQGAEVKPGEPTYERGVYAHTILRSVLDPDDGQPFFASVAEMLDPATGLDRDRLAMLFELQQIAQADFAPRAGKLTNAEFFSLLERTAEAPEGTDLPFERLPRGTQRSFVRGMARLYRETATGYLTLLQETSRLRSEIASHTAKSSPGPVSPDTATSLPEPAESPSPTTSPGAGES